MENLEWVKLTIPNKLSHLQMALLYVEEAAKLIGFGKKEIKEIILGAEEAISNVIKHAYEKEENEQFDIICNQTPLGIKIIIKEKGIPYDPKLFPKYNPDAPLKKQTGTGLGLFLMKESMDEISFHNLGFEGKEVHLIKFLPHTNITKHVNSSEIAQFEKEKKSEPRKNVKFIIRRIKPEEAIEISKCVYKTYGYSYFSEHVYYPERILELNKSGHLITAVGVTEDGEFAGSCALSKDEVDDKIAEIGQAVVKPVFRGNKCLERLTEYLINVAKSEEMLGIFGQAVTNHIYSQKAIHRLGTKDCAIRLGYLPSTMVFKKITEELGQRETVVLSFLPLQKEHNINAYLPLHHKEMIKKIYSNIGFNPTFVDIEKEKGFIQHDSSVIETTILNIAGNAKIKVKQYGKDIMPRIKEQLKDICLKHIDAIYLHLNLEDPLTQILTQDFEKMGFFFCGIFPGESSGDSLILQYLNNISIDFDKIQLHSVFAMELLKYIKESMENDPIKILIKGGENDKLEFKSTLRWNQKEDKKDWSMEYTVMKTITAFMNSFGGTLLIGVKDDGSIIGIEADKFQNEDKYLLHFSNLIKKYIGLEYSECINYYFVDLEGKKIMKVDCSRNKKPVFMKLGDKEEFYIRSGPSSIKLPISKVIKYIDNHFPNS